MSNFTNHVHLSVICAHMADCLHHLRYVRFSHADNMNNADLLKALELGEKAHKELLAVRDEIIKANNGWIDIKDGGFNDREEILITDGKEVWTDTVMFDCADNDYYIYFYSGLDPETVTHWQPLPQPPKE